MLKKLWPFLIIFFTFSSNIIALTTENPLSFDKMDDLENLEKGITVDLRHPKFCEGVLSTEEGGVITGPNIRIQAMKIIYTRKKFEGKPVFKIEAEEDVVLEFGEYEFIGKRLEYDFQTKTGVIYNARSSMEPWYFGGDRIELCADASYVIYNGFITTSENYKTDWQIESEKAVLCENNLLSAKNVRFRFIKLPLFWIPSFRINLDTIFDNPFRYTVHWGGRQKTCFSMIYEIFSWRRFKAFLQVDYRIKRGFGGGIHTVYSSPDHKENLETITYLARDTAVDNPHERTRYRYQGVYSNLLDHDRISVLFTYDKLSDKDMATDYHDNGLELDTAGRTQLLLRRQEDIWLANFIARFRVNTFQTIKQEIPTFEGSLRPFRIGSTGIIAENQFKTSYLDFEYSKQLEHVHDYNSTRYEASHRIYRPINVGPLTATPELGGLIIYYGNSPQHRPRWLALGMFGFDLNTSLYRFYGDCKHVVKPYMKYEYLTFPSASPHQHYIFDIEDGWYRLDMLNFGVSNNFYYKTNSDCIRRYLSVDLFANAFFDTPTIPRSIPKMYAKVTWNSFPTLRHIFVSGWDFKFGEWDHFNLRTEWTISPNIAFATEYRHRDAYDWRKADKTNFILDSYRSIKELKHSQLSDRRDTLLFHLFFRWLPNWALEFESRHGWNRRREPNYNEYEIDLITRLQSALQVKIAYQHKEYDRRDNRIAIYFSVGMKRPDQCACTDICPCVEF